MTISGRKSKMTKGRLDGAVVQFTQTAWTEDESKSGKDVVNLSTVFSDVDEQEYPRKFYLGDQKFVRVNGDGALESVDESRDYTISMDMAAGKILASLEDAGFSGKKLDGIGDDASVLDGQWVRLKEVPGSGLKQDGTPFMELLVDELVDAPTSGGGGSKKKTAAATKKKVAKKVEDEDEEEETPEDDDEETTDDDDDPIRAAALDAMTKILTSLSTKTPLVKNFDEDAANGGITIKQAYTASFGVLKGKDVKGPGSNLINDPDFHLANAAEGLYKFSKKTGIITPS